MIQAQLKLRLTCAQESQFNRWLWHLTGVYNWAIKTLERERHAGRRLSRRDLHRLLKGHSAKVGVSTEALRGTADTAHDAWTRHITKQNRRPRLKGRRRPLNSICLSDGISSWKGSRPVVYTVGPLRVHAQPVPAGRIGYARIVKRASGWYLCLFIQADAAPIARVADGQVGVDPGFSSLLTLSTGETVSRADELDATAAQLARAQRGQRKRLTARLHERVGTQRKNRNHLLSRRLVSENTLIAFSKDPSAGMARMFGKSVASSAHSQLRSMLRYKSLLGGTEYIEVPSRNSTKTCSACGCLSGPSGLAGLKVRQWVCGACGAHHDRDINAAINTLTAGLGMSLKGSREAASGISARTKHREIHERTARDEP